MRNLGSDWSFTTLQELLENISEDLVIFVKDLNTDCVEQGRTFLGGFTGYDARNGELWVRLVYSGEPLMQRLVTKKAPLLT